MGKTVGMMQPYLFPYLGYFQLIAAVDVFVLGDTLQYIKQGWVNRNRILENGRVQYLTLPLNRASYTAAINERVLADRFPLEMERMLKRITFAYARAPFFKSVYPVLEEIITFPERNLAIHVENSIRTLCCYMEIDTPFLISSHLCIEGEFTAESRVIETVRRVGGDVYINPHGGMDLYHFDEFKRHGITLKFSRMNEVQYQQFDTRFEPSLSIIDVLMFNDIATVKTLLLNFSLQEEPINVNTASLQFA
ncbi:MAG: WbqC family protein [Herminiimonas sp.]|nr:WbqC family protein [Herminiimonas sp.]